MYYILTTVFEDHWDNVKNNKTYYTKKFLRIKASDLKEKTETLFLKLDKATKKNVLKAWYGLVYDIKENVENIEFCVDIKTEIELEPDIVRTKIGWFIIESDLPFKSGKLEKPDLKDVKINIQELKGKWNYGYALDVHTLHSILLVDGHFDTTRTQIGELLYKLKYCKDKIVLPEIKKYIQKFSYEESEKKKNIISDIIIPVPPSDTSRVYQPVNEIAKLFGKELGIEIDETYLIKLKKTSELKGISDVFEREKILKDAFKVKDTKYEGKSVLIIDDLFRSGSTINEIAKVLKEKGKVDKINVMTLTKTRVKK